MCQSSKLSSLRAKRGNPHALSAARPPKGKRASAQTGRALHWPMDCRVALRLAFDEEGGHAPHSGQPALRSGKPILRLGKRALRSGKPVLRSGRHALRLPKPTPRLPERALCNPPPARRVILSTATLFNLKAFHHDATY
jgi:hypothetical protein